MRWKSSQSDQAAAAKNSAPQASLVASGPWATSAGQKPASTSDTKPPEVPKIDRDQRKTTRHSTVDQTVAIARDAASIACGSLPSVERYCRPRKAASLSRQSG